MLKTETRFRQNFGKGWKRKQEQKQGLLECHETAIQEQKRGLGAGLARTESIKQGLIELFSHFFEQELSVEEKKKSI